jgi:hypothetical protein
MKDTKQIIDDCGIADTRAGSFLADIVYRKFTPSHADGAIEETMGEIIGALYRRIEKLEEEKLKFKITTVDLLYHRDAEDQSPEVVRARRLIQLEAAK